ncbi:hypothetical protein MP638_005399 [Amoeboaphelidium occidentale]|nr:hypothetical protein MP638_005399 [Amoeboaphelidium occidentale]
MAPSKERLNIGAQAAITGVLSMFDVWSDLVLLSFYYQDSKSSNSWVWFTLSAIIVGFASLAMAYQVKNINIKYRYAMALAALVQGHWFWLFYGILKKESLNNLKETFERFQGNSTIEVVFESMPQLYLQLYILLHGYLDADGKKGTGSQELSAEAFQIATIIFSLLMAVKTLATNRNTGYFLAGPGQIYSKDLKMTMVAHFFHFLHTLSCVLGRALVIAIGAALSAAYQYGRLIGSVPDGGILFGWPLVNIVAVMFGVRASYALYQMFSGRRLARNVVDVVYSILSTLISSMVRSYFQDPVLEILVITEGAIISYCSNVWITKQLTDPSYSVFNNSTNSTMMTNSNTYAVNVSAVINGTHALPYNSVNFPKLPEVYANMQAFLSFGVLMIALHAASSIALRLIKRYGWGLIMQE